MGHRTPAHRFSRTVSHQRHRWSKKPRAIPGGSTSHIPTRYDPYDVLPFDLVRPPFENWHMHEFGHHVPHEKRFSTIVGSARRTRSDVRLTITPEPGVGVWGDDWIHAPSFGLLGCHPTGGHIDRDELVFVTPAIGRGDIETCLGAIVPTSLSSISEAIGLSMRWRVNAAYFDHRYQYAHDVLAVAAWYGIVATGRRAWMPVAFAQYFDGSTFDEIAAVARCVFVSGWRRPLLDGLIRSGARTALRSATPCLVRGVTLTCRPGRQPSNAGRTAPEFVPLVF